MELWVTVDDLRAVFGRKRFVLFGHDGGRAYPIRFLAVMPEFMDFQRFLNVNDHRKWCINLTRVPCVRSHFMYLLTAEQIVADLNLRLPEQ